MSKVSIAIISTHVLLLFNFCASQQGPIDICSQSYVQPIGSIEIKSPFYPSSYRPSTLCQVRVQASWRKIKVEFFDFSLENEANCGYDYLSIAGKRYCGRHNDKTVFIENMHLQSFDLEFKTDGGTEMSGFRIKLSDNYVPIEVFAHGIQSFTLPVNLKSPGYPNPYSNNQAGMINLTVTKYTTRVKINFVKFELEDGESGICKQDVLQIHNSRFCGNHTGEVIEMNIPDTGFSVLFSSDGTIKTSGFLVEISHVPNICNQHSAISQFPFNITSPSYPDVYQNDISCTVSVALTSVPQILLTFLSFDVEAEEKTNCKFDALRIGNRSYCGNRTGETLELDVLGMSSLPLIFTTDPSEQRNGFNIEVSLPTVYDICQTREMTLPAYIKTPNYPEQYPHKSRCETIFTVMGGIIIEFQDFELEENADFLYINEIRYSGRQSRKAIRLDKPGNTLQLRFTSDKTVTTKGFFIKIAAINPGV